MKQSVRALWTPLLGEIWAERLAADVKRFVIGYVIYFLFYLSLIAIPLLWRGSAWAWVLAGTAGVLGVLSVLIAWRPFLHTSKELGAALRAGGLTFKQNPGTQNVIAYRRWLRSNGLTAEQVREVAVHELP